MVILGLTGSIGMGKSAAAADFRRLGVAVHDADAAVHELLGPGGAAVAAVSAAFPGVADGPAIDRRKLGAAVFGDDPALDQLEAVLHPLVREHERCFLGIMARRRRSLVVLDIPLLFETGGEARCDAVVTVTAPAFVQSRRVLARPGMTRERLTAILSRQTPDPEKRRRSDFVVNTGLGRAESLRTIATIVRIAGTWQGRNWPSRPYRPFGRD